MYNIYIYIYVYRDESLERYSCKKVQRRVVIPECRDNISFAYINRYLKI